jgi:hypothetical protein
MASAILQRAVGQGERFPTEWSLNYRDEPDSGRQLQPSEDVRPDDRVLVSLVEDTGARHYGIKA